MTLPVKVASAGVDAVTTSQSEADEKRGRELRKAEARCRKGKPRPDDDCTAREAALRYFLDTEYNGWGGALLSLALVADSGEELYVVLDHEGPLEPWVERHVVPYFDSVPDSLADPAPVARRRGRGAGLFPRRRSRPA